MKTFHSKDTIYVQSGVKLTDMQFGWRGMRLNIFILIFSGFLGVLIPNHLGFASMVRLQETTPSEETKLSDSDTSAAEGEAVKSIDSKETAVQTENANKRRFEWHQVFQLLVVAMVVFWGYSLVMSGRHGQGWLVLLVIVGAVTYVGRMFGSVFQEVTTNNDVKDWEDD